MKTKNTYDAHPNLFDWCYEEPAEATGLEYFNPEDTEETFFEEYDRDWLIALYTDKSLTYNHNIILMKVNDDYEIYRQDSTSLFSLLGLPSCTYNTPFGIVHGAAFECDDLDFFLPLIEEYGKEVKIIDAADGF